MAIGFTIDGLRSAYFGAEPWVGSKTATSSPILALQAKPNPPTNPANPSLIISPNIFSATNTPYVSGFFVNHIICASIFVSHNSISG